MPTYQSNYQGELRIESTHLQSNTSIFTDAPTDNHGKGQAFSPTDLVALALGNCILTTMAIFGQKEEILFEGSSITGTKVMTSEGPRKIQEIIVTLTIKTNTTLDQAQKDKYERIAHTCPVARSLSAELIQKVSFVWL
jgi:putative redox protein